MLKCIKESFSLTNKNIILATPLILFSLLSSLYLIFSINGNVIGLVIAVILFVLMLASFLSGWFNMIKIVIKNPERDEENSLMSEFMSGVGEYFLPALGLIFSTFIFSSIIMFISYYIGMKFIGDTGISSELLSKATGSSDALKSFVTSLTPAQYEKLSLWNILIVCMSTILSFLLMFYSPAIFFKKKNPFIAFFVQFKDLFSSKFFKNVLLFIIVSLSYFVVSIIGAIASMNIVLHFIFTLVNFYYMVFVAVFVYNYYFINYVKIGGNVDTTV